MHRPPETTPSGCIGHTLLKCEGGTWNESAQTHADGTACASVFSKFLCFISTFFFVLYWKQSGSETYALIDQRIDVVEAESIGLTNPGHLDAAACDAVGMKPPKPAPNDTTSETLFEISAVHFGPSLVRN